MRSLRERALAGERLIGVLLRMPSEELTEMAAVAGMDFIVLDGEHGPDDVVALRHHIALADAHGVGVIVRIGEGDEGQILRALDQGAQGILAPHLESREDAEEIVAASLYPPVGRRGFATYSRAGRFGLRDPLAHRDWYLENTLLLGMIESPDAVTAVDDIAATPRLDGIMIGPADLAAATGPRDRPVAESISTVHAALRRAGRLRMDIVGASDAAAEAFEDGADLVVYNLAHALMAQLTRLAAVAGAR